MTTTRRTFRLPLLGTALLALSLIAILPVAPAWGDEPTGRNDRREAGGAISFEFNRAFISHAAAPRAGHEDTFRFTFGPYFGLFITDEIMLGYELPIRYVETPDTRHWGARGQELGVGFTYAVRYHFLDRGSSPYLGFGLGYEFDYARYALSPGVVAKEKFDGLLTRVGFGYLFILDELKHGDLAARAAMDFVYRRLEQRGSASSRDMFSMMFTLGFVGLF